MQKESHRCCLCLDFSVMTFPITETVICCKRLQTAGKRRMEQDNWNWGRYRMRYNPYQSSVGLWSSTSSAGGSFFFVFVFFSDLLQHLADADTF